MEKRWILHNRTIASAIRIMRKWWYPMKGMNLEIPTAKRTGAMVIEDEEVCVYVRLWYVTGSCRNDVQSKATESCSNGSPKGPGVRESGLYGMRALSLFCFQSFSCQENVVRFTWECRCRVTRSLWLLKLWNATRMDTSGMLVTAKSSKQ